MAGRVRGLVSSVRFAQEDIEKFTTAQRLRDNVRESTWNKVFRRALTNYCNFLNKTPDEIIEDRKITLRAEEEEIRRTDEEIYGRFWKWLEQQHSQQNKRKKLATWTVASQLTTIRSFYDNNYYPLVKVKSPDSYNERPLHVPTPEELGLIVKKAPEAEHKAMILAEAQSGISIGDLLNIRWDTRSDTYGTVKKQVSLENGLGIVHIHFVRKKSRVSFDSFWGHSTLEVLRSPEMPKDGETVFTFSARTFERVVRDVAEDAKIEGEVTCHSLRKFFSTRLKLTRLNDPAWNDTLIEYWQGHALGRVRRAYFIPPPEEQARLYLLAEPRLSPVYP